LKSTGTDYPGVGGYSPDGKFLVYARNNDPKVGEGGLFVLSANGTEQRRLVEGPKLGPTTFGNPFWSPDGKHIVFISNRSSQQRMWSIRVVDGKPQGEPEQLAVNIGNDGRGFTRDGSFYYLKGETQVEAYAGGFDPEAMRILNYKPITDQAIGNNLVS
jgi:Tol biopolymer transport system component